MSSIQSTVFRELHADVAKNKLPDVFSEALKRLLLIKKIVNCL